MNSIAKFKPIDPALARALLEFVDRRNLGKTVEIDGQDYVLSYISQNSNAFFQSRGLSIYFKTARSIIRISDHWSKSLGNDRSRKLNCGSISGKTWILDGATDRISFDRYAGKYPWVMLAGRCGLASLNKTCDHWSE